MKKLYSLKTAIAFGIATFVFANTISAQWFTTGNNASANNILGTLTNVPLNIYTAGTKRVVINPTYTASGSTAQPVINGVGWPQINTSGYFGISPSGYFSNHPVATLLHLYGSNNTNWTSAGWRKWMQSGILINENSDAMYVGLKSEGNNRSDAIIGWSDDVGSGGNGADKLRFIFTAASANGNPTANAINGYALNGYEFMRIG